MTPVALAQFVRLTYSACHHLSLEAQALEFLGEILRMNAWMQSRRYFQAKPHPQKTNHAHLGEDPIETRRPSRYH